MIGVENESEGKRVLICPKVSASKCLSTNGFLWFPVLGVEGNVEANVTVGKCSCDKFALELVKLLYSATTLKGSTGNCSLSYVACSPG